MEQALDIFYKLHKLHRVAIVLLICLLLVVGFYFLFVSDRWAEIDKLEKDIAKINNDIKSEQEIKNQGPQLEKKLKELAERLGSMVASLPEQQDIEPLLQRITELLSETNLVSERFIPGKETKDTKLGYAKIPITLKVKGDYHKQGAFFASVHDLPRLVNVPSIKLRKASGLSGREKDLERKLNVVSLEGEISAETYRRLSQSELMPADKGKKK
jgi:type IV pilus assembly protein PilO